jgi:Kef-type K+ transport system membrane component KefB
MQVFDFLPVLPLSLNGLALFGMLLITGFVAGELAERFLRVPKITGYVLCGLLAGPSMLGWYDNFFITQSRVFVDIALGLLVFEIGRYLDFTWFRRNPMIVFSAVLAGAFAFVFVAAMLIMTGFNTVPALLVAAIAMSTSPAVVVMVTRDLRAEGQVVERALTITAVNAVMSFFTVTVLLSVLHLDQRAEWLLALLHPLYVLLGSIIAGVLAGALAVVLARIVGPKQGRQFVVLVGVILIAVGAAQILKLSVLIALLTLGAIARNVERLHMREVDVLGSGRLFIIVLFVVVGASLKLDALAAAGFAILGLIVARAAGKALALVMLASASGLSWQKSLWLSLALLPMSGTAIVLAQDISALYPAVGAQVMPTVLAMVAILELIGPLAVQLAFKHANETMVLSTRETT